MKLLLTNDDGYGAPGIEALYQELRSDHEIVVAAPDRERSAVGHAITLNESLRVTQRFMQEGHQGYAVSGTPADCVKLALFKFYTTPPDMVISGINAGSNTGININYSGTVGAAREAALNGIQSIAVSIKRGEGMDFRGVARFIASMVRKVQANRLPPGTFLNINAPDTPFEMVSGVKITRQADTNLSTRFEHRVDPRDRSYFWYARMDAQESGADTDDNALSENCISMTPIQCDLTNYSAMGSLKQFMEKIPHE